MLPNEAIEKLYFKYEQMTYAEKVAVYESTEKFIKEKLQLECYEKEYNPITHYYFYNMLTGKTKDDYIVSYEIIFEKANKLITFYKKVNQNCNFFDNTVKTLKPINLFFQFKKPDEKYIKL